MARPRRSRKSRTARVARPAIRGVLVEALDAEAGGAELELEVLPPKVAAGITVTAACVVVLDAELEVEEEAVLARFHVTGCRERSLRISKEPLTEKGAPTFRSGPCWRTKLELLYALL